MPTAKKTAAAKKKPATRKAMPVKVIDGEKAITMNLADAMVYITEKAATIVLEKIGPEMHEVFAAMEQRLSPKSGTAESFAPVHRTASTSGKRPAGTHWGTAARTARQCCLADRNHQYDAPRI